MDGGEGEEEEAREWAESWGMGKAERGRMIKADDGQAGRAQGLNCGV